MHLNNDYISRYRTVPAASYTDNLSCSVIPYLPCCDGDEQLFQSTPMHYHPETEIVYIEQGPWQYRSAASDSYRIANAGDFVFFPPYEPHEAAIRADSDGYITHCICFDTKLLAAIPAKESIALQQLLSASNGMQSLYIAREQDTNQCLYRAFSAMMDALNAPGQCEELLFYGALLTFFGYLRRISDLCDDAAAAQAPAEQAFARAVIDFTEQNFAGVISTRVTAASLNYSEPYFCRMFRRVFHMCYSDYLNRLRISKVCPLLQTMSVTDAAASCGFTHMSQFSNIFRRCMKMSPTEYQQLLRRNITPSS